MKAARYSACGPPSVLRLVTDEPVPCRKRGECLVRVETAAVNRLEVKARGGALPRLMIKLPQVPGGDMAGVVVEADEGSAFRPGSQVMALTDGFQPNTRHGTFAELVSVPVDQLAAMPPGLSFEEGASLPLVSLTAHQALEAGEVRKGQRLLVHAGAGGVGSAAIQLAKARGMHVTTTCSAANADFVKQLGADEVVDYREQRFEEVLKGRPFDLVIDTVGDDYEPRSLGLVGKYGTFVSLLAGKAVFMPVVKGYVRSFLGLGPRYKVVSVAPNGRQLAELAKLAAAGTLKPIVHSVLPLERASEAHEQVESKHTRGKVVVRIRAAADRAEE